MSVFDFLQPRPSSAKSAQGQIDQAPVDIEPIFSAGLWVSEPEWQEIEIGGQSAQVGAAGRSVYKTIEDLRKHDPTLRPTSLAMLRAFDAAVIPRPENIAGLGNVEWRRNQSGSYAIVRCTVWTTRILAGIVNPRGDNKLRAEMRKEGFSVIHGYDPNSDWFVVKCDSADHLLAQRTAQRATFPRLALTESRYQNEKHRDFYNSLANRGIEQPIRAVFAEYISSDSSSTALSTWDGHTRLSNAQFLTGHITGSLSEADQSILPWTYGGGAATLRDWTIESIEEANTRLRDLGDLTGWDPRPGNISKTAISDWIENASLEQQAYLRLQIAPAEITIAVKPREGRTPSAVLFGSMAGLHIPDAVNAIEEWDKEDVLTSVGRQMVADMASSGHLSYAQLAIASGEQDLAWDDDSLDETTRGRFEGQQDNPGRPFRNPATATACLMNVMAVDDPRVPERYIESKRSQVAHTGKAHLHRATAYTAQLCVELAMPNVKRPFKVSAHSVIRRLFEQPSIRDLKSSPGHRNTEYWPDFTEWCVEDLEAQALAELGTYAYPSRGPAATALYTRALLSHIFNDALVEYIETAYRNKKLKGQTMSMSGRGARAGKGAATPWTIFEHMALCADGIAQLAAIVRAVEGPGEHLLPKEPGSETVLGEDRLRHWWTKEPKGRARRLYEEADENVQLELDLFSVAPNPENGMTEEGWEEANVELRSAIIKIKERIGEMQEAKAGPAALGIPEEDWEYDSARTMFDHFGVDPKFATQTNPPLSEINQFYSQGPMNFYQMKLDLG